MGANKHLNN